MTAARRLAIATIGFRGGVGGASVSGTVYIETFGLEILEMLDVEVIEDIITIEVVEVTDIEVVEDIIEVEIPC